MCTKTLWHTIETTTIVLPNVETFVHTGDIDDLWLRDSAAQIHPLLIPMFPITDSHNNTIISSLMQIDLKLNRIVAGLIQRHIFYIHHDPYANAFRIDTSYIFNNEQKLLGRHDYISTYNYELDSACYTFRMIYYYYKNTIGYNNNNNNNELDNDHYNDYSYVIQKDTVLDAIEIMIDLWIAEQKHEDDIYPNSTLLHNCTNCYKPYRYATLARDGKGAPTNSSAGLTWNGFRPSDDECIYGYLIPSNIFCMIVLDYIMEMINDINMWPQINIIRKNNIYNKAKQLQNDINRGINEHGIINHDKYGLIYAYEVDGFGNYILMDDANVPSLLSIPYLFGNKHHHLYNETIYNNTLQFLLSNDNPYYHSSGENMFMNGTTIKGIGSPHTKDNIPNNIWPMSIAILGLITNNITEKVMYIEQLVSLSATTYWMHESIDINNPYSFTRYWFCWADSLYAELVMSITNECPNILYQYNVNQWYDPIHINSSSIYSSS